MVSPCGGDVVCAPQFLFAVTFVTSDAAHLREYLKSIHISVSEPRLDDKDFTAILSDQHKVRFIDASLLNGSSVAAAKSNLRIIHAGFVVHDQAAVEHFYKDILGFRPYWHGGMKDDRTDWMDLQVPDGTDWVEFMLNVSPDADKRTLGIMNHIALGVPDIHAAYKQLLTNGMKLTEEPKIGRDGKWQLNLYDPDQTRVEMMEFTPVEKPCCSEYTGPHPKP
ncbi:MAG TPA: VOC family protein [Candidatus Acidoferrum sp.]